MESHVPKTIEVLEAESQKLTRLIIELDKEPEKNKVKLKQLRDQKKKIRETINSLNKNYTEFLKNNGLIE